MSDQVGAVPEPVFLVEGQDRALARLMTGMDEGGHWIVLLGPEGIGKSTVLRRLLAELELTEADSVICNGAEALGPDGLVAVLRSRLHLPPRLEPRSLWGSRPLEDLLANQRARRKPLVVVVDDAHVLSPPSLVLLAELAAKPGASDPAVFVVLAGLPALEQPALRAWNGVTGGRSAVTCRLGPFTAAEVRQYVERRTSLPLSDVAVERIVQHTGGVPGLINALGDRVIGHPSSRLRDHVSADTVDEAAEQLGLRTSLTRRAWGPAHGEPPVRGESLDAQDDQLAWHRPTSGRGWRRAGLLTAVALVAGVLVFVGPSLLRSALDWFAAVGRDVTPSAPEPNGLSASHPEGSRRDAASRPIAAGRGASSAVTPSRRGGEQRMTALDRVNRATTIPRAAKAPRPVAVPPSPQQVAALLAGARDGEVADLDRLLAAGVPANVADGNGFTPLMLAVVNGHLAAARALLDRGALVNARNRGGITPVMLAVINDHPEMLAVLLERGADVNAQSGTGWTALTFAAWKGDADLVRLLLGHGANPAALDKQRWTPLDYAASRARSRSTLPQETETGAATPAEPSEPR